MRFNKDLFAKHLNCKDYYFCINMLRDEIIHIIGLRIKEKNSQFVYTTLKALKINCFKYLSDFEQDIAIELYDLSSNESPDYVKLSCMMNIYDELI